MRFDGGTDLIHSSMSRYKSEVAQQKVLFRGSFGTQRPGGARHNAFDIFMKNAANTSVVLWGGRLLALFEAAQPTAMDPTTLQTLGPDLLGGTVKPGASFHFGKVANRLSGEPLGCLSLQQGCFLLLLVHFTAYCKSISKHVS